MGWFAIVVALHMAACGPPSIWRGASPNLARSFQVDASGDRTCLRLDDGGRECYDGLALRQIVFSPDSRRMAYPARVGEAWFVVVDGRRVGPFAGVGELVFSPDGGQLAYVVEREGLWTVLVDGDTVGSFDSVYGGSPTFDASGRRFAFAASRRGRSVVVLDGVAGPPHQGVGLLRFSEDGGRFAYVGREGTQVRLVVDGVSGRAHDDVTEFHFLRGGATGGSVAYVARDDSSWWVIDGADRYGPYQEAKGLTHRPWDGALVFVARDESGTRAVVAGEALVPYDDVETPVFSPAGERWGYIAHAEVESTVVLDGRVVDAGNWAADLSFTRDGGRFAYVLGGPAGDAVVHDRGAEPFDLVVSQTLQFLPEWNLWTCLAGDAESRSFFVAVEDHEETQRLDWSEFLGMAGTRAGALPNEAMASEALRAWIRAVADRVIRDAREK